MEAKGLKGELGDESRRLAAEAASASGSTAERENRGKVESA